MWRDDIGYRKMYMKKNIYRLLAQATAVSMIATSLFAYVPAKAASLTSMTDVLTRVKVSTAASHSLYFATPTGVEASTDTITVTFASGAPGFVLTSLVVGDVQLHVSTATTDCANASYATAKTVAAAPSTSPTWGYGLSGQIVTLTAPTDAASGEITAGRCVRVKFNNDHITNPGSAGSYAVTVGGTFGDTGSLGVGITSDDQVIVTATVDPTLTFNIGATNATCDNAFAGNGGTVALGTLQSTAVAASGATRNGAGGTVEHICARLSTNATAGYNVTVKSTNGSLKSTSASADMIPVAAVTGTPTSVTSTSGTPSYGLCFGTGGTSGVDVTTPVGTAPSATSPYNPTCTSSTTIGDLYGQLSTTTSQVLSGASVAQNAWATLRVKALISATTPAHNDYTDTLTFVATGTF